MEVKNSKVVSVQSNGTWEGTYGIMYKFEVVFQNGDVGEYSSKNDNQDKFVQGIETEYEYHGGKFPKVKPVWKPKPGMYKGTLDHNKAFGKSDDVQIKIVRQSMIKASVDFWAMNPELKPTVEDVLRTATKFVDYVNGTSEPQFSQEFTQPSAKPEATPKELQANDLPF